MVQISWHLVAPNARPLPNMIVLNNVNMNGRTCRYAPWAGLFDGSLQQIFTVNRFAFEKTLLVFFSKGLPDESLLKIFPGWSLVESATEKSLTERSSNFGRVSHKTFSASSEALSQSHTKVVRESRFRPTKLFEIQRPSDCRTKMIYSLSKCAAKLRQSLELLGLNVRPREPSKKAGYYHAPVVASTCHEPTD